jgi:hypothetical protein
VDAMTNVERSNIAASIDNAGFGDTGVDWTSPPPTEVVDDGLSDRRETEIGRQRADDDPVGAAAREQREAERLEHKLETEQQARDDLMRKDNVDVDHDSASDPVVAVERAVIEVGDDLTAGSVSTVLGAANDLVTDPIGSVAHAPEAAVATVANVVDEAGEVADDVLNTVGDVVGGVGGFVDDGLGDLFGGGDVPEDRVSDSDGDGLTD